jgi:hypothetical protein
VTGTAAALFLTRMAGTAAVVLAATWAVDRAGPRVGGVVAGLPMVVGPGLAFLALTLPPADLALAATGALASLTGTQAFVLAYALAAARVAPQRALAAAMLGWAAVAVVLALVPNPGVWAAAALFLAATVLARTALHRLAPAAGTGRAAGWRVVALRAGLAGLLVGGVTLAAGALGPRLAGLLLAYPVGMTVIAVSLHQRAGAAVTVATLRGAVTGMASLAAFCLTAALAVVPLGAGWGLVAALGASAAVSGSLLMADLRPRR